MKIFLPIALQATGGTSVFARKCAASMKAKGHTVVFTEPDTYDVLLVPARCPWRYLERARRKRRPVIHRLDGVYYPATVAGRLYWAHNLVLSTILHHYATAVIYQSYYSKYCADLFLGRTSQPRTVIYNGVDTNHFTPRGQRIPLRKDASQHVFITWSSFRRRDQLLPLLAAMDYYVRYYHKNSILVLLGDVVPSLQRFLTNASSQPFLRYQGIVSSEDIPLYARDADVFVMTHQNPPCPNNVLEAMSCGLPICGVADGAMPELATPGVNAELLPAPENGFKQFRHLDPASFANLMHVTYERRQAYGEKARAEARSRFSLNDMSAAYSDFMQTHD